MTDSDFRNLCRADYKQQLALSGYNKTQIKEQLKLQANHFYKADIYWSERGGSLVIVNGKNAFLFYIIVYEKFRGKGHGKFILMMLEDRLKKEGITKLQLNVFGHNKIAQKLYKDYTVISSLMEKKL